MDRVKENKKSFREEMTSNTEVYVIVKKGVERSLLEWKPVNSRITKIRIKGKQINTTIIQCYAQTNDSDMDAKEF